MWFQSLAELMEIFCQVHGITGTYLVLRLAISLKETGNWDYNIASRVDYRTHHFMKPTAGEIMQPAAQEF